MINLAVIGCGVIAQFHLKALATCADARVAALADLRPDVVRATAERFGIPRWTSDPQEILKDPSIDGVVLAIPTRGRTELGLEVLRHGKHLLTEKPVAMNAGEVASLISAQNGLIGACCSSRYRVFESARFTTEFLRDGGLGEIRSMRVRALIPPGPPPTNPPPSWRLSIAENGGGILVNWGCYDLDYMMGLMEFKLQPAHVLAKTWTVPAAYRAYAAPGSDAETHALALVTFTNGAALNYERSEFSASPLETAWQITGERGTLLLQFVKSAQAQITLIEPAPQGVQSRVLWSGDESGINEVGSPIVDFVEAIRDRRPPRTSLANAHLVAKITDAVYASSKTKAPVSVT